MLLGPGAGLLVPPQRSALSTLPPRLCPRHSGTRPRLVTPMGLPAVGPWPQPAGQSRRRDRSAWVCPDGRRGLGGCALFPRRARPRRWPAAMLGGGEKELCCEAGTAQPYPRPHGGHRLFVAVSQGLLNPLDG